MVIIARRIVLDFIDDFPKAKDPLWRWFNLTRQADWSDFSELKKDFGSADSVGNGLYVFNISGNSYRLIARLFSGQEHCISGLSERIVNMIKLFYRIYKCGIILKSNN